jgi:cytochrome c oxidase subunit 1
MVGVGVMSDWFKWARGIETPEHPTDAFPRGWPRYLSASFDHKAIGIQYGVTSIIIFLLAGLFALIFRTNGN